MAKTHSRARQLLLTARNNPEFAARLLQQLPEPTRSEAVNLMSAPLESLRKAAPKPGLKKCGADKNRANNGMSAQLNLFAQSVSKVG